MEIHLKSSRIQKACNNERESVRAWGSLNARKLRQRLAELSAAETLERMRKLPAARCHPLKGDRDGQFAVDLAHPYRLVFEPVNNPIPKTNDGGIDLEKVTAIKILSVEDYHGE
jgi:proteic killer suppression protein